MGLFGFGKEKRVGDSGQAGEATLDDGSVLQIARSVDCIGDSCPRPQLMTKKEISESSAGEVIQVLVDNPSSMEAIPPMLTGLQATHLGTLKRERRWEIYIRRN